jgi:hypothetical protein
MDEANYFYLLVLQETVRVKSKKYQLMREEQVESHDLR